jgi:hypothetical protein
MRKRNYPSFLHITEYLIHSTEPLRRQSHYIHLTVQKYVLRAYFGGNSGKSILKFDRTQPSHGAMSIP